MPAVVCRGRSQFCFLGRPVPLPAETRPLTPCHRSRCRRFTFPRDSAGSVPEQGREDAGRTLPPEYSSAAGGVERCGVEASRPGPPDLARA